MNNCFAAIGALRHILPAYRRQGAVLVIPAVPEVLPQQRKADNGYKMGYIGLARCNSFYLCCNHLSYLLFLRNSSSPYPSAVLQAEEWAAVTTRQR